MKRTRMFLMTLNETGLSALGCGSTESATSTVRRDGAATFDVTAMRTDIEARNRHFNNAHVIGYSATMVNICTADARLLPPGADPVIGRRAIEALTAQYLTFGITEFREETTAFYGNQDLLIDEGTYVMVYDKGKKAEEGKHVNIWGKEAGEWKTYSNMWNSNAPSGADK